MNRPPFIRPFDPALHAPCLRDESRRSGTADFVALPSTEDEVRETLRFALAHSLPVTVQGARTGITAGAVPEGGLVLALSRLAAIAPDNPDPRTNRPRLRVGPAATLAAVREACPPGHFFSPDPTEPTASIGGMVSCNSSGARSFLYGPVRPHVSALRVLAEDPDAPAFDFLRGRDRLRGLDFPFPSAPPRTLPALPPPPPAKNAAGYFLRPDMDALDLFIGAEGTLGIVVSATLSLLPAPPAICALLAFPPSTEAAATAVAALRTAFPPANSEPAQLAALEFFCPASLDLLRTLAEPIALQAPPTAAALYAEFHAPSPAAAEEALLRAAEALDAAGTPSDSAIPADTPSALAAFKAFRHRLPEAVNASIDAVRRTYPSIVKLSTDMSVPDPLLPDLLALYRDAFSGTGLRHVLFGHIGDNHLHLNVIPRDPEELARARALLDSLAPRVVAWHGSLSAEHGIGKAKKHLLPLMYPAALPACRALRDLFAPRRLLSPTTLF